MTTGPARHAEAAAEAVRTLNHATRPGARLTGPVDVYDVLGALALLAGRLPQVLSQLQAFLIAEHTAGRIAIVDDQHTSDPAAAVADLSRSLDGAAGHADLMGQALKRAQATAAWVVRTD